MPHHQPAKHVNATSTVIPDVLILEPRVFGDERGFFFESFNARRFAELTGCNEPFVQDNHSRSHRGVLRGLHYQLPPSAQGKLVRATRGEILDVVVDIRRSSDTFGQSVSVELSESNFRQLWVPAGFAHGFLTCSEVAEVEYKVTAYYDPAAERSIVWNDPALALDWAGVSAPRLSPKDAEAPRLADAQVFV